MTAALAPPAARIEFLRRERAMRALRKMDILVAKGDGISPSVIETLWQMLNDNGTRVLTERTIDRKGRESTKHVEVIRVSEKLKITIATAFMRISAMKELALSERGLGKGPQTVENHTHFVQINLSHEELAQLPEKIRSRVIEQQLALVTP